MSGEASEISETSESKTQTLEDRCIDISNQALSEAKKRMEDSLSRKDLPKYIRDYEYAIFAFSPANAINVSKAYEPDLDLQKYKTYFDVDYGNEYRGKQANAVKDMVETIKEVPEKSGHAIVAVQRDQGSENPSSNFGRILVRFPEGSYVKDPLRLDGNVTKENPYTVYLDLGGEVCVDQAAMKLSDSFEVKGNVKKTADQKITFGYVPYTNPGENWNEVMGNNPQNDPNRKVEFYEESTGVSRQEAAYIMGALCGNASGLRRIKIPESLIS